MNTLSDSPSKTSSFRFEFPPQVLAEREQIISEILRLMIEDSLPAIQEACRMQLSWLERYPDDYVMLDLGESLWMLADAIEAYTHAMNEGALEAIKKAGALGWDWVARYPKDYAVWDAGEPLSMLADAIEATSSEAAPAEEHALSAGR